MTTFRCPACNTTLDVTVYTRTGYHNNRKFDHDQALGLLRFGATVTEVANTFGVSKQRISQIKRQANI